MPSRPGVVLLTVLLVLVILTLAAYQYGELMLAEYKAADSSMRSVQALALADSGIHYTAAALSSPDALANTLGGNPYDNPTSLHAVAISAAEQERRSGRFSIIAPVDANEPGAGEQIYRNGVMDEMGKLNVNALLKLDSSGKIAHDILILLPNMNEDLVNAILDWIDPDSEPRSGGGENEYYQTQKPSYNCKNGPLDSVEELLLVKGITPRLLFGNDRNRNGILDPDEDDGTGTLDRGLAAYLTVYSREQNLDSEGKARIYVNKSNLQQLADELQQAVGPDLANYIIAYRMYGPASTQSSSGRSSGSSGSGQGSSGGSSRSGPLTRSSLDLRRGGSRRISSLYELVNSSVSIPGRTSQSPATRYSSPLNDSGGQKELLPKLLDKVTTSQDAEVPGRVNVNTAPEAVLAALPGMTDREVRSILDHRRGRSAADMLAPAYQTPAWLLSEAGVPLETLRTLERYITARSQVYRVQSLGYFDGGGPTARVEAIIDTNGGRPRIIYWRNLTELGKGYDLGVQR
jgi:type II secretory pathway component PulK